MSACAECLLRSLLDNEAAGFAERATLPADEARKLLGLPQDELLERLRGRDERVDERLRERIDGLLDGSMVRGLWTVCRHGGGFPVAFEHLLQTPAVIYGLGSRERFAQIELHHGVAVVGARRASNYGRAVAFELGRDLAAAGMTVVSGMALGIDGAAHRGALQIGGRTIAVLAGGPERAYPRSHTRLYDQIVADGAVVSERPPGARAQRWGFPARNRLIAALAVKTIVVEGTLTSGAMHTVDFAEGLGQTASAVPGAVTSPLSDGPNKMIFEGGELVRDARDVLDQIYGAGQLGTRTGSSAAANVTAGETETERVTSESAVEDAAESDEPRRAAPPTIAETLPAPLAEVMTSVRSGETAPSAISARNPHLSARAVAAALGELELRGHLRRDPSGRYRLLSAARDSTAATTR